MYKRQAGYQAGEPQGTLDIELGEQDTGGAVGDEAHQRGYHRCV